MKRTQLVCLHEGTNNSVDHTFVNSFIKAYNPNWLRPFNRKKVDCKPCGGKSELLLKFIQELKNWASFGEAATLIVMSDVDDKLSNCDEYKEIFRKEAKEANISDDLFNKVLFVFPKDRIENWIEYINDGATDEDTEGPRVENDVAANAARELARRCKSSGGETVMPPSLTWSCRNWRSLVEHMKAD